MTFLLEVGCEEIPAAMILPAVEALSAAILASLGGLASEARASHEFGGPRRLTACITGIRRREEDREERLHGPPRAAAYDADGRPTRAAEGFARKHGVTPADLTLVSTPRGEVISLTRQIRGRTAAQVLSESCPGILKKLRFGKMMRWGDRGYAFVRPIHWILALLDEEIVPFEFMGVRSGRSTRGHRFLGAGPHQVPTATDCARVLLEEGRIVARHEDRKKILVEGAQRAAAEAGGRIRRDDDLVAELTFLTEHPAVVSGRFPEEFLSLPEPVLMTAMRHHQKYLAVEGEDGKLRNAFVGVLTTREDPEGLIRRGNEWVLKARLADAQFFYNEDQKVPLRDRVQDLAGVTFHARLGSYADKTERVRKILPPLAAALGLSDAERRALQEASGLCKTDLSTGMVGEFPELQGIVGGIYARLQGHGEICARAIEEHYRPTGASDPVPSPGAPSALALADKLDTLALCFSAGLIPRGSADPYALRRAALGVLRILVENEVRLDLRPILAAALDHAAPLAREAAQSRGAARKQGQRPPAAPAVALGDFLAQRLRFLMEGSGIRFDAARAVLAVGWEDPLLAWRRAAALNQLRGEDDFLALAAAAKRVRNILSQASEKGMAAGEGSVESSSLRERAEEGLHREMARVRKEATARSESHDHRGALSAIASLRPAVDRFFDDVLVMDPDESIRRNRLALLADLSDLLSREADFAEVVVEGN
jgi:glycyl-tRNA synthetase beta chain